MKCCNHSTNKLHLESDWLRLYSMTTGKMAGPIGEKKKK